MIEILSAPLEIAGRSIEILSAPIEAVSRSSRREAERAVAARLVKERFGEDAIIGHREDGAPFLKGRGAWLEGKGAVFDGLGECMDGREMFISISHCADMCVVAVSDTPVGVDIETLRPRLASVAQRFLTTTELSRLKALSPCSTTRNELYLKLLLHCWTAKEAVFKCASIPSLVISEIEITLDDNLLQASATARDRNFYITFSTPAPRHLLALSTQAIKI